MLRSSTLKVWAKPLWAGLNLSSDDLPGNSADTYYPMELIRAITLSWLFSGLRSDELSRLRVGRVRWQHDGQPIAADSPDVLAEEAVCLLPEHPDQGLHRSRLLRSQRAHH